MHTLKLFPETFLQPVAVQEDTNGAMGTKTQNSAKLTPLTLTLRSAKNKSLGVYKNSTPAFYDTSARPPYKSTNKLTDVRTFTGMATVVSRTRPAGQSFVLPDLFYQRE